MSAHISNGLKALRLAKDVGLWITTRIAIKLPEERDLDGSAAASAIAVPGAVAGTAAGQVGVDGVVAVTSGIGLRDHLAYFCKNRRDLLPASGCACVQRMGEGRNTGSNLAVGAGVLVRCSGVLSSAESGVPLIHASHFVAGVAGPRCSPEDRLGDRGGHDGATMPTHICVARCSCRADHAFRPVHAVRLGLRV